MIEIIIATTALATFLVTLMAWINPHPREKLLEKLGQIQDIRTEKKRKEKAQKWKTYAKETPKPANIGEKQFMQVVAHHFDHPQGTPSCGSNIYSITTTEEPEDFCNLVKEKHKAIATKRPWKDRNPCPRCSKYIAARHERRGEINV